MSSERNPRLSPPTLDPSPPEVGIAQAEPCTEAVSGGGGEWYADEDLDDDPAPLPTPDPDVWLYRDRTAALLWRYTRLAVELGRLPSLLGREFFRARVSRYDAQTFEDSVIFVHDVECCLQLLDPADKVLIAMLALEQNTQEETARSLRCTQRTIVRHYGEALDRLSEIFLKREVLVPLPGKNTMAPKACQEGKTGDFAVSDSA
jgi:DNA-directed RNA polymerase specialized sigma24 family protein